MPPRDRLPPWPLWAALLAVLIAIVLAVFGFAVVRAVLVVGGIEAGTGDPELTVPSLLVQDLALVLAAVLAASLLAGRPTPADFGLRLVPPGRALGAAVLAMLVFYAFSAVWGAALGLEQSDDLPAELGADKSVLALVAIGVLVVVLAPIVEEFFFRGFLYTTLRRGLGTGAATLLVGVLFGAVHAGSTDPGFLVPLAVLGAALAELYRRTGSLLPCMAAHSFNNAIALSVTQGFSAPVGVLVVAGGLAGVALIVGPVAYRASRASATSPASSASMPPLL